MLLLHKDRYGSIISGSDAAVKAAVLAGDDIAIALDADDAYREVLSLTTCGVDHSTDVSFGVVQIPHSGYGDQFDGSQPYDMWAVFLSDRRSFHARYQSAWTSTTPRSNGSKANPDRYGYYKWFGTGRTRSVIGSSADSASMFAVLAAIQSGDLVDYRIRFTLKNNSGNNQMTWILPRDSILYDPKRPPEIGFDTWLMKWKITNPDLPSWTVKSNGVPYPSEYNPRNASFSSPYALTIAKVIIHSGGYASFHGLPVWLGVPGPYEFTAPVGHDLISPGTLVEVLGPPV